MRTPRPLPEGAAERLAALLKEAQSKAEYQRIQCVWLRAALGLRAIQIATALGWQVGSVRQVHSDYLRQGEAVLRSKPSGGRHRQNLTVEQEKELLLPFLQQAEIGGVLVIAPVQAAYEAAVGRSVHHSVVYRALPRQGWRKVVPRPRHPKGDEAAREAFQKVTRDDPRSSKAVRRVWSTRTLDVGGRGAFRTHQ
jgi:transposase